MISWYPEHLALKGVLQGGEAGLRLSNHQLFVVGVGFVVAVADIPSH